MPAVALICLALVWAEKALDWTTVAFYWLAIILLRTMATNIADLATHDVGLSYSVFLAILVAFMAAIMWADRVRNRPPAAVPNDGPRLPATDASYWVLMLAAGVLGTALGDGLSDAGLGVYWSSLLGAPKFVVAVPAAYRFGLTKPWYWIAIATCRTWGTDLGDMLVVMFRSVSSRPVALWISTGITAVLLGAVIVFWTRRSRAAEPDTVPQQG